MQREYFFYIKIFYRLHRLYCTLYASQTKTVEQKEKKRVPFPTYLFLQYRLYQKDPGKNQQKSGAKKVRR